MRIIYFFVLFTIGSITWAFFSFLLNPFVAFLIAVFVILTVITVLVALKSKKLSGILENECNPLRSIEAFEKFKKFSGKIKFQNMCNTNIAVGFMDLGEYRKALSLLKNIDSSMNQNKSLPIYYHLALMSCYIGLSDLENAKFEYENYIQKSRRKFSVDNFVIDSAVMKYNYQLQKSHETAKYYLDMLYYQQKAYDKIISKRRKLHLLFRIATIEQELGNIENAVENYKIVAESGNFLWIATESNNKLNELNISLHS